MELFNAVSFLEIRVRSYAIVPSALLLLCMSASHSHVLKYEETIKIFPQFMIMFI